MYVHGFFLPWIEQQRAEGKLSEGKFWPFSYFNSGNALVKEFHNTLDYYYEYDYNGEIDSNSWFDYKPLGYGVAYLKHKNRTRYGFWLDG